MIGIKPSLILAPAYLETSSDFKPRSLVLATLRERCCCDFHGSADHKIAFQLRLVSLGHGAIANRLSSDCPTGTLLKNAVEVLLGWGEQGQPTQAGDRQPQERFHESCTDEEF